MPRPAKQSNPTHRTMLPHEARKLLNDVDIIVAAGLKAGLISYPRGTIIDDEGVPIIKYPPNKKRPVETYQCLRAFLLRQQGQRLNDIARIIKCATRNLPEILEHGELIYHKNIRDSKESLSKP